MSWVGIRQMADSEGQRGSRSGQEGWLTPPIRASWSTVVWHLSGVSPSQYPSKAVTHPGTNHHVCCLTTLYMLHHKSWLPQPGYRSDLYTYSVTFLSIFSWLRPEDRAYAKLTGTPIPVTGAWRWQWCHLSSLCLPLNVALVGSFTK